MKKFKFVKNIINTNSITQKIKIVLILTILLFIYSTISAFSYAKTVSTDLANSVFRLHIIANSNTDYDQELKYVVRNALLEYMNELCFNVTDKEVAMQLANSHLDDFKKIALQTITDNGYSYDVNIEIGNFEFPTKYYGDISLPSGYYDALKIEIGEAKGENWWCVMFPPLCFVDMTSGVVPDESKESLSDNLSSEEFTLISTDDNSSIEFKFKILELFSEYSIFTANN